MATYIPYRGEDSDQPGLYLVQTTPSPPYTCDIFFVHGLGGGPTRTWRHPKTGTIWFQDLLPTYIADAGHGTNARIWTFGYNAGLGYSAKASIYDYSQQLLHRVKGVMEGHEHHKIIWVCHSLGGLVVKSALIDAHLNPQYRFLLDATIGIVFLGTPHQGSNAASMATILARIAAKTMVVRPPTELLRVLQRESDELDQSLARFLHICQNIRICTFHEMLPFGRQLIVERSSAVMYLQNEERLGLNANHVDLCKFQGHDDQNFVPVCGAIRSLTRMSKPIPTTHTISYNNRSRPLPTPPQQVTPATIVSSSPEMIDLGRPVHATQTVVLPSNLSNPGPSNLSPQSEVALAVTYDTSQYRGQLFPNVDHLDASSSRTVTNRDIPQLFRELTTTRYSDSRVNAAKHLADLGQTSEGRADIADAITPSVIPHLVSYLSDPSSLRYHALVILARVLFFKKTWAPALDTQAIPLLIRILYHGSIDDKKIAAYGLANITQSDAAKVTAAESGAIPPLALALDTPSSELKGIAIRALRNIVATEAGRAAAYNSNVLQGLIALFDNDVLSSKEQYDVVSSLETLASHNKAAKEMMKKMGMFHKLDKYKSKTVAKNLRDVAISLRDMLR